MTQNPVTTVFEAQRTAIEQSQSMTHDALEAQQTSFSAFADMVSSSESMLEQNAELTKSAIHTYLDALEANMPEETADFAEVREMVDEGFDAAAETQSQTVEAVVEAIEESGAAYEEFSEGYAEVVDNSFDAFLEAHEQMESSVSEVAENVEEATEEFDVSA